MTNATPEREIPLGMLAKHDIAFLIQEKQMIRNCLPTNLKKPVYEMRLGSFAFRWEGDKRKNIRLGDQQGKEKELILPPNSLTFVTTLERFNLPDDIIARFNLKVDWVHRGLLLGTGPIVNPGFKKYLLIPIHNFSSQTVQIKYAEQLIAVEFTKIPLSPDSEVRCSSEAQAGEEDIEELVKSYCEQSRLVESSVYKAMQESKEELESQKKARIVFTWVGAASVLAVAIALASLVFTTWSVHADTRQKVLTAHEALLTTSDRLEKENTKIRNELAVLKEQFRVLSTSASGSSPETKAQEPQEQLNTKELDATQQYGPKAQSSPSSEEKISTQK